MAGQPAKVVRRVVMPLLYAGESQRPYTNGGLDQLHLQSE